MELQSEIQFLDFFPLRWEKKVTREETRQGTPSTGLGLRTVAHRAERLQMAVTSNEMEAIIDPAPTVRPTAAGS